jgi:hypothetical protein
MDLSGAVAPQPHMVALPHLSNMASMGFSSAEFDSADAGSGAFAEHYTSMLNILQHHMNVATNVTEDERDFLRPWRRRLRDVIQKESDNLVAFLEKPAAEWPVSVHHSELVRAMDTAGLSGSVESRITPVVDNEMVLNEINSELDVPLDTVRTNIHKMMDNYLKTIASLFELNHRIEHKLQQLDTLKKKLDTLSGLDDDGSEELRTLQESILQYIQSRYVALNIQDDYIAFVKDYTKFQAYRSVLLSTTGGANHHGNPLCSICTTERVTSALVPCGHVFCNNCSQKQRTQCYVCRTTVRDRLRIYFI